MKRIGLIGGLSPESTVHYYQILCREYNHAYGGLNFPEIVVVSLNLQELVTLFDTNDWDGVATILLTALERLRVAGADFAAILANTSHNAYDRIRDVAPLEILTIMDAAALGGLDTLVFAGGIGENAPMVRARICDGLGFHGVELEEKRNAANERVISSKASRVGVHVIHTDEERIIARLVCRVLELCMSSEKRNSDHATKYISRLCPFSTHGVPP